MAYITVSRSMFSGKMLASVFKNGVDYVLPNDNVMKNTIGKKVLGIHIIEDEVAIEIED